MQGGWEGIAAAIGLHDAEGDDFVAAMQEIDAAEAALVQHMADLCQLPDDEQHAALVEWARSEYWHPALMLCAGWQGAVGRAAWRALKNDLAADTPGRRWHGLDPSIGRACIARLLGVADEAASFYASIPFRSWQDDDGRSWIAAAVSCPPVFDAAAALRWTHLDIRDVILWDPRTGEVQVAGEHSSISAFIMPDDPQDEVTIWGDGGAFFRAWAQERLRVGELARARASGTWVHPLHESRDGGLPGGLLVGDVRAARWPAISANAVRAGAGVKARDLYRAALRSAALPKFRLH